MAYNECNWDVWQSILT